MTAEETWQTWGSYSSMAEETCLLTCYAVPTGK